MAPEQANGQPVDARCDLFSLGCVLYRMATGQDAFWGQDMRSTLAAVLLHDPVPPAQRNPDLPPELARLILQLLAKNPADRPQSAREVARVLVALQKQEPPAGDAPAPDGMPSLPSGSLAQGKGISEQTRSALQEPGLPGSAAPPVVVPAPGRSPVSRRLVWVGAALVAAVALGLYYSLPALIRVATNQGEAVDQGKAEPVTGSPLAQPPASEDGRRDWPPEQVAHLGEAKQRHWGPVHHVALSPDAKWVASSGDDDMRLWDARTMQERMIAPSAGHLEPAFSADSKWLAIDTQLWDLSAGEPRRGPNLGQKGRLQAFSPDGKSLAFGHEGVAVWDFSAPEDKKWAVVLKEKLSLQSLSFGNHGKLLAAAVMPPGQPIRVWDLRDDQWVERPPVGLPGPTQVGQLALSPHGSLLAAACHDGHEASVRVWNLSGPQVVLLETLHDFPSGNLAVAWAANGQTLAVASVAEKAIGFWSVSPTALKLRGMLKDFSIPHTPMALAFSGDGRTLVSGGKDGTVRLFDLTRNPARELFPLRGVSGPVEVLAFSPVGSLLAAGNPHDIRLWDLAKLPAREPAVVAPAALASRRFLSVSADGTRLLTDRHLWDFSQSQKPLAEFSASWAAFSPRDSRTAVLASRGVPASHVQLVDFSHDQLRVVDSVRLPGNIDSLAFSPDGRSVFFGTGDGNLHPWDVAGTSLRARPIIRSAHPSLISAIAFTADGRTMATGGNDQVVKLWHLHNAQPQESNALPAPQWVTSLAFSPGDNMLAATGGTVVSLWAHPAGKTLREWRFPGTVSQSAFSPDGRYLATANKNGTVSVFRVDKLD
jgi:WD40 repeat protein